MLINKRNIFTLSLIFKLLFVISSSSALADPVYSGSKKLEKGIALPKVEKNKEKIIELSLENFLRLALKSSSLMSILKISQQIAEENLLAAQKMLNPTLSTSLEFGREISPFFLDSMLDSTSDRAVSFIANDIGRFSTTWSKKTTSGIAYSLSYRKLYKKAEFGYFQDWGVNFSGWSDLDDAVYFDNLAASINIPVFQDWGNINKLPEYKGQVELKKTTIESKKQKLEFLESAANIYWDMVIVNENIKALKSAVDVARQFVKDTIAKYKIGVFDSIEVKQSESQLSMIQQSLSESIMRKREIEDMIKVAFNLEDMESAYKPIEQLRVREHKWNFSDILEQVYTKNYELVVLKLALQVKELDLKEARNKLKNDLDLIFQYQLNAYENSLSKTSANFSDSKSHDYKVGVTWKVPLFDTLNSQKLKKLELEKKQLNLRLIEKKSQIRIQLRAIIRKLNSMEKRIELADIGVSLARELFNN